MEFRQFMIKDLKIDINSCIQKNRKFQPQIKDQFYKIGGGVLVLGFIGWSSRALTKLPLEGLS